MSVKPALGILFSLCLFAAAIYNDRSHASSASSNGVPTIETIADPGTAGELPNATSAESTKNGFTIVLHSDKALFRQDEKITLYATLTYAGPQSSVTIWHADPYLTFELVDDHGERFTDNLAKMSLSSTSLSKGQVYIHPFKKAGSYSESDPKANFWRRFYKDPDLYLPAGNYTATAIASFSLHKMAPNMAVSAKLRITVTE